MNTRVTPLPDTPAIKRTGAVRDIFDFAVGISRQPLPQGNLFAIVTKTNGPRIKATDAAIRQGLDLTTLRPEILEFRPAKLPLTANVLCPVRRDGTLSITERARVGLKLITNGVKQKLPGAGLLGVESFP